LKGEKKKKREKEGPFSPEEERIKEGWEGKGTVPRCGEKKGRKGKKHLPVPAGNEEGKKKRERWVSWLRKE